MVKAILILDNDGNRILSRYYDPNIFCSFKEERAFEKKLFAKTNRVNAEITMLDGMTCLYKSNVDVMFYVLGSQTENEVRSLSITFSADLNETPQRVSFNHTSLAF